MNQDVQLALDALKPILADAPYPGKRHVIRHFVKMADYRGKCQWVVGYTWCRANSHYASGMAYDAIVGWGDNLQAAMNRAKSKVTPPPAAP